LIDRVLSWFWTRVARSVAVPDRSLTAFRWILGLYLLLFDAPYYSWISDTPRAFFDPPVLSVTYLFSGFPPATFFLLLDVVAITATCCMTVGYRTRISTATTLITRLVGMNFIYSYGKISHQIAVCVFLFCMIIADWGETREQDPEHEGATSRRWSPETSYRTIQGMSLFAVALAFGFVTAGFDKARLWINTDLAKSGILTWYYPGYFTGSTRFLADRIPGLPLVVLKAGDWLAAIVEVTGFIALLLNRTSWRVWLLVVTLLHTANVLVLNITFATQVILYLSFFDLSSLVDSPLMRRLRRPAVGLVVVIGAWHVITRFTDNGSSYFMVSGQARVYTYDLYVALVICTIVAGIIAKNLIESSRPLLPTRSRSTS